MERPLSFTHNSGLDRVARMKAPETKSDEVAQKLHNIRGIGVGGAWVTSKEMFGWRDFKNRRQVGGYSGLVGSRAVCPRSGPAPACQ